MTAEFLEHRLHLRLHEALDRGPNAVAMRNEREAQLAPDRLCTIVRARYLSRQLLPLLRSQGRSRQRRLRTNLFREARKCKQVRLRTVRGFRIRINPLKLRLEPAPRIVAPGAPQFFAREFRVEQRQFPLSEFVHATIDDALHPAGERVSDLMRHILSERCRGKNR